MEKENLPLYWKVYRQLREKIQQGELHADQKITERQLLNHFRVSRVTVRKALALLVKDGYLYRIPGLGTFLTSSLPEEPLPWTKNNRSIGILIPCITRSLYSGIVRGAENFLLPRDYSLILGSYDARPEKEKLYLERFLSQGISGLIVAPSYNSDRNTYQELLVQRKIPFVQVDTALPGIQADLVQTDGMKGGYLGTRYLIHSGCQKIAFLCGHFKGNSNSLYRLEGYRQALQEAGLTYNLDLVFEGDFSFSFGYETTRKLLSRQRVDGIFSANEPITLGVLQALEESSSFVQDKILVASFDELSSPVTNFFPLITVKQPRLIIGEVAAEILLQRIQEKRKKQTSHYRQILLSPELDVSAVERKRKTLLASVNT